MTTASWLAVAGLGAFHGINPAMGWLFAVALGLHRRSRAVVLEALVPIALGHTLAVTIVGVIVVGLGAIVEPRPIRLASGVVLIGWALFHAVRGGRHRLRVGMQVGMLGLGAWSFLMATAHGAGLMLVPFLLAVDPRAAAAAAAHGSGHAHEIGVSLVTSLAAIGVHVATMLLVTGVVAVLVYEWVGLAFLRRRWFNLDRLWTAALAGTGLLLLAAGA